MSNLAAAGNDMKKHIRTFTYMIGLIVAIVVFNILGYVFNKELEKGQVAHVWCFTTAFLVVVDLYIDVKYHAYWYFTKGVDWASLPAALLLIPPVNIIFKTGTRGTAKLQLILNTLLNGKWFCYPTS
ncbi:hypothetical protein [Priestia megaterium]|uniref:hypothetical protein n=1 Tax=Priestia megaterium TaxID=1404 RepID=UPI002E224ED3